jgi:hypothetical protein
MGVLIPNGVRRNPVSTAVWLASKRRNALRNEYIYGPTPPFGSVVYYDFAQENLANAVKELVNKQSVLISARASNANIIQSRDGSVITYGENEPAFNIGTGLRVEGEATNLITYSEDFTQWMLRGSAQVLSNTELAPDGTNTAALIRVSNQLVDDIRLSLGVVFTPDATIKPSLWIKPVSTSGLITVLQQAGGAIYGKMDGDVSSLPSGWARITDDSKYLNNTVPWVASTTGSGGLLISTGNSGDTIDILVWGAQIEESEFMSSYIKTTGMAATRAASNEQIPCLVEKGVWLDSPSDNGGANPCVLGNYNVGAYGGGVSAGTMTFLRDGGAETAGKYEGLLDSAFSGAVVTAIDTGSKVKGTFSNSNTFVFQLLKGSADDFKYPAKLRIDFTTSDYFTGDFPTDTTTVGNLRDAAGDDVPSLGVAEQWPANDFTLDIRFKYLGQRDTSSPIIAESTVDSDNRFVIFKNDVALNRVQCLLRVGGVSVNATANLPSDIDIGDEVLTSITLSGGSLTNQTENITKGESITANALTASAVPWTNTLQLFTTPSLFAYINADVKTITLRPL